MRWHQWVEEAMTRAQIVFCRWLHKLGAVELVEAEIVGVDGMVLGLRMKDWAWELLGDRGDAAEHVAVFSAGYYSAHLVPSYGWNPMKVELKNIMGSGDGKYVITLGYADFEMASEDVLEAMTGMN